MIDLNFFSDALVPKGIPAGDAALTLFKSRAVSNKSKAFFMVGLE